MRDIAGAMGRSTSGDDKGANVGKESAIQRTSLRPWRDLVKMAPPMWWGVYPSSCSLDAVDVRGRGPARRRRHPTDHPGTLWKVAYSSLPTPSSLVLTTFFTAIYSVMDSGYTTEKSPNGTPWDVEERHLFFLFHFLTVYAYLLHTDAMSCGLTTEAPPDGPSWDVVKR